MGNRLENNRDYRVSRGQGLVGFGNENKGEIKIWVALNSAVNGNP